MSIDNLTGEIINVAICVHRNLGPGMFESVYEEVMDFELKRRGYKPKRQLAIPVIYKTIKMDIGFRADLVINDKVLVEIKSIESLAAVHKKQVQTYLRLTKIKTGLLINFNVELLKYGITRVFNNYVT